MYPCITGNQSQSSKPATAGCLFHCKLQKLLQLLGLHTLKIILFWDGGGKHPLSIDLLSVLRPCLIIQHLFRFNHREKKLLHFMQETHLIFCKRWVFFSGFVRQWTKPLGGKKKEISLINSQQWQTLYTPFPENQYNILNGHFHTLPFSY